MFYDKIILGAGIYGLYAAEQCGRRGEKVLVLERDSQPFMRATYINPARVNMGYCYPRSITTAINSAKHFKRFQKDFAFCEHTQFNQLYATSSDLSWTNADEFRRFCTSAGLRCDDISPDGYFNTGMCDGAFLTTEYTYDAQILKEYYLELLAGMPNVSLRCGTRPAEIRQSGEVWRIVTNGGHIDSTPFVFNATYAGTNDVHVLAGFEPLPVKYEMCEIIICEASPMLANMGITVVDGPFFSITPFGKTGFHALTSMSFTPHQTCSDKVVKFNCQQNSNNLCRAGSLYNCNICPGKPESAWPQISKLAHKYLKDEYDFKYVQSLYSIKPIVNTSYIDNAHPTVIRTMHEAPKFVSVLSGQINTVYDIDEVLR